MVDKRTAKRLLNQPQVVGTIHSDASLKAAIGLKPGDVDFLEVRVDAFIGREKEILNHLSRLRHPLIITVRHPSEGGMQAISPARRRRCFEMFLPHATLIDVELRFAQSLKDVISQAHKAGVKVILSHHNFRATPSLEFLRKLSPAAIKAGADILKIATTVSKPSDLAALLSLPRPRQKPLLSLMGMGRFGKVSRLLLAQAGSVLNYGFLDKAQVPGQWPAILLKQRISELLED